MKLDYYQLNTYYPELDGPAPVLYQKFLEQADAAEACGFDTAWFTEHHFRRFGGMVPNTMMLMAAVAQRTKRIRLGTAVVILPLHHPIEVAEQVAMLDVLSGGRCDLGIGRGMGNLEYRMFKADWPTAQEQMQEQIAILRAAWTNRPFSWHGKFYDFPDAVDVLPPPAQQPHPPIWVTANTSEAHFRWIGLQGFNLMTLPWILPNFARSRALIDIYREGLAEGGHDPATREVLAMFPTYCGETPAQARKEAEAHWLNWRSLAMEESREAPPPVQQAIGRLSFDVMLGEARGVFGDPATCKAQLQHIGAELGVTHVGGVYHFGGLAQDRVLASMQLVGSEVAPALRPAN